MSDHGLSIYNGARSKALTYITSKFNLKVKKYTNPADVLLKVAHQPELLGLSPERLKVYADRTLRKDLRQLETQYLIDVEELRVDRHASFLKECAIQARRWAVGFTRVPIAIFGMFGLSTFLVALIGSIYGGVGLIDEDLGLLENKPRFQEWLGLSFYMAMDLFAISVMSQVIQIPTRNALYRKEHQAGLYSVHSYYLVTWVMQNMLMMVYPLIGSIGVFVQLGLKDQSWSNFIEFVKTAMLICFTGSNLGIMWGTFFDNEATSMISSLLFLILGALGGGKFINLNNKSRVVYWLSTLSPIRYAVERFFRRIVSQYEDYDSFLLGFFRFNQGDDKCEKALLLFSLVFFLIGWANMTYKSNRI
jgi:hypothetical protein